MKLPAVTFGSKETCALVLLLIAFADLSILFNIPVLRQILVFVLITLLPGFLLIQLLRVTTSPLEKTLFLIGLSVSFLMFVPLVMNLAYPVLGIVRPISLGALAITFSLILAVLSVVAYWRGDFDFRVTHGDLRTLSKRIFSPPVLGAALILVLGILGGLFMRCYLYSLVALLSMLSIAAIAVVIALSRRISPRYYPLFIIVIALALQYSHTLASPNLFGADVHYELYFADLVRANGVWNSDFAISDIAFSDYSAMLSVTILPNVYSILMNVDIISYVQLVVPFVFAFVPLGVYRLCETQLKFSSRSAFLAAFFFMSFFAFFYEIPRQQIAELFLVLTILVMLNRRLQPTKSAALLILFISSMVVSHYTTSYIFLILLVVLLIGSVLLGVRKRQIESSSVINLTVAILAVSMCLGWYIFAAGGTPYQCMVQVGTHAYDTLFVELFSRENTYVAAGTGGAVAGLPFTHVIGRYWVIATEVLIAVGVVAIVWKRKTSWMNERFLLLVWASFCIMLVSVAVPVLGSAMTAYRLYALVLIFLAPCCVLGVGAIVDAASRLFNRDSVFKRNAGGSGGKPLTCVLLICVLVPYFLFSYNFIFEVAENPSNYVVLPSQTQVARTLKYSDNESWSYFAQTPIPITSNAAIKWFSSTMDANSSIYTVKRAEVVSFGHISPDSVNYLSLKTLNQTFENAYFYLGAENVQQQTVQLTVNGTDQQVQISSLPTLNDGNLIYSNGLAEVLYRT